MRRMSFSTLFAGSQFPTFNGGDPGQMLFVVRENLGNLPVFHDGGDVAVDEIDVFLQIMADGLLD